MSVFMDRGILDASVNAMIRKEMASYTPGSAEEAEAAEIWAAK